MTSASQLAIDDRPKYRRCTESFVHRYPATFEELESRSEDIENNVEVAEALIAAGESDKARRVCTCGRTLVGNFPIDLRPEYYCRMPAWCDHCSRVLANLRAEQWMEACSRFSEKIRRAELVMHTLLIQPDTYGSFDTPMMDFHFTMKLLLSFKTSLSNFHKDQNRRPPKRITGAYRRRLLGPTVSTIHVTPAGPDVYRPTAHMHLIVVSSTELGKRKMLQNIQTLWRNFRQSSPFHYDTKVEEVTRSKSPRRPKREEEDESQRDARMGHFWPSVENDISHTYVKTQMNYMSKLFKSRWDGYTRVRAMHLLEDCNVTPEQLHQRLGMEGVVRKDFPHSFRKEQLQQRYAARYDAAHGWQIYQR